MASLRARLLAALLALTAAGMLLLGGITYAEQRSFQLERVDQQARAAIGIVGRELAGGGPRVRRRPSRPGRRAAVPTSARRSACTASAATATAT